MTEPIDQLKKIVIVLLIKMFNTNLLIGKFTDICSDLNIG